MAGMDQETLKLIESYKTPREVIQRLLGIRTIILSGISAAGKDTIQQRMLLDEKYQKVVTSTTRAPRENNGVMEVEGEDYYFLTLEQARDNMRNGEYIEVMNVHGRANGSLIKEYERIAQRGSVALTDIDYQGAARFLEFGMERLSVFFIVPPSFDTWLKRLTVRYGDSLNDNQDEVINRMHSAKKEIAFARNDPRFIPVVNDDIERVAEEIKAIADGQIELSQETIQNNYAILDDLLQGIETYLETHG